MKKIFHGWRMVGAASAIQFMQSGMLNQAFGAYVATLSSERGWSKTSLSGAAALQSVESAVIGPLLGWVLDRFGPQGVIRLGVLILGIGFMLLSQIESIAGMYGAMIVMALGSSMCGYFPLNVAVMHWFRRYRARALSSVSMGLALGGFFVPVVAWTMQQVGWRVTAFASGVLIIVIGYPLARVMRRRPEDMGETVDGLPPEAPGSETQVSESHADSQPAFTPSQALRTQAFWLLSVGHGLALLVVTAVNVHAISHIRQSLNYSIAQASLFITLMTAAQAGGVFLGWVIGDRFEKRYVAAACMFLHAAGILSLTYATGSAMLVAFALLHGVAWGLRGPFMQAIRADYFGTRSIGMILGLSALVISLGQVGGPLVAGAMADLSGDYRSGFTLLGILAALGSVMFLMAKRPRPA
ncbi:MAG: MFS transporter [Burkholderiales bacterium]|nr:MFS transporter [Burkholderiales bacterium]